MSWVGLLVFIVTYLLISVRNISRWGFDRPAGALLGAVACVALGVLSPEKALGAIDGNTLLLLFGVMGMGAFLSLDGFFDGMAHIASSWAKTPARLLGGLVWLSGLLSAFITNDAVCILGAPLVVKLIQRHKLPALPFLLALATSANTGSVATLVGNPQNMLCGLLGNLSYLQHVLWVGPWAFVALGLNHAWLHVLFRRDLKQPLKVSQQPARLNPRSYVTLGVIFLTSVVYTFGGSLAWTAVGGCVALMLLHRQNTRTLWPQIDWAVLLFFSGLFVVAEAFLSTGIPESFFALFPWKNGQGLLQHELALSGLFLVGSNVVSNVPFILMVKNQMAHLANPTLGWELLAMASTFAGNLTLLGSVANIIVSEAGRDVGGLSFWAHFKVGFPLALATTAVGTVGLWWSAS